MKRSDQPHAAERALPEQKPILSEVGRAELLGGLLGLAALIYLLAPLEAWLIAEAERVHTSALVKCAPPGEAEQLHVVVRNQAGRLITAGCMYVGGPGSKKK